MLFLFLAHENGATDVKGFVEGDDGLFKVTPPSAAPTKQQFADLGFTIKIGTTKNLSEASFCGQVYDMDDLIVVTDPMEVLARVGWTNKKYTQCSPKTSMELLRAKGFSLSYQYNGCPVLSVLGRRILKLTEEHVVSEKTLRNLDQWEREKMRLAMRLPPVKNIGENTRALVEKLYGLSVADQLQMEKEFENIQLGLHVLPNLSVCPPQWVEYYERYSVPYRSRDPCWLVAPERNFLNKFTKAYPCVQKMVASLKVG